MKDCNCKNKVNTDVVPETTTKKNNYTLKIIAFLVFLVFSPIVFLFLLWFGFKMLVLNDSINIKSIVSFIANKIASETKENEDIDDIDDPSNYILLEVDDLTEKK